MFHPLLRLVLIVLACCFGAAAVHAAEPKRLAGGGERRVALVIGNAKYPGAALRNPANDARDIASALRRIGFDVIEKTDVTQKEMNRAITQFGSRLTGDTVALFFYAGHGMQVRGKNYLIPIDAQIENESAVRAEAVDVDAVLDQLGASPLNIVILDACRNNPFERRFRGTGGGLAQMDAPKGTLIAYATSPGKVASDGEGRNGLYTQELLKVIQTPGMEVEKALKRVRANVARATGDNQIPWEASSLTGDFYFNRGEVASAPSGGTTPAAAPAVHVLNEAEREQRFWDRIRDSRDSADFQDYLSQYPQGGFAAEARLMVRKLQAAATPAPTPVSAPAAKPATPPPSPTRLGVVIQDVTPALARALGSDAGGAMVAQVEKGSAADRAGLVSGDVVLRFQEHAIAKGADLVARVGAGKPGDSVRLHVRRAGQTLDLPVTLGRAPAVAPGTAPTPRREEPDFLAAFFASSVQFSSLPAASQQQLSAAGFALKPDDRIVGLLDKGRLSKSVSAKVLDERLAVDDAFSLLVLRGGSQVFLSAEKTPPADAKDKAE